MPLLTSNAPTLSAFWTTKSTSFSFFVRYQKRSNPSSRLRAIRKSPMALSIKCPLRRSCPPDLSRTSVTHSLDPQDDQPTANPCHRDREGYQRGSPDAICPIPGAVDEHAVFSCALNQRYHREPLSARIARKTWDKTGMPPQVSPRMQQWLWRSWRFFTADCRSVLWCHPSAIGPILCRWHCRRSSRHNSCIRTHRHLSHAPSV